MAHWQLKGKSRIVNVIMVLITFSLIFGCASKTNKEEASGSQAIQSSSPEKSISAGRMINAVEVLQKSDRTVEIQINGNQKLVYTSIKQSFPFGIAIYLPETGISETLNTNFPTVSDIEKISVQYADTKKTTAKIEILLNDDLDYTVANAETSLTFFLSKKAEADRAESKITVQNVQPSTEIKSDIQTASALTPVDIPNSTATLSDIQFTTDQEGNSDIHIKTSHPVKYHISSGKDKQLYLNLEKTIIPKHHQRPLITTYFKSAIERVLPMQEGSDTAGTSRIEINLRDQVPYHIFQNQEGIFLSFEPTSVQPPVFAKAKKSIGNTVTTQNIQASNTSGLSQDDLKEQSEIESITEELFGPPKVYTGEKIKLDFYETDIKNVFRILRSVSGINFAIDKDVTGKVTMTLDNPVPWDQVLDLVLKMNNLGKIQEGNVLRIATNDTLRNENLNRQEIINAKKKELDQKKSLEPLVTEYIPINYSDAEKEIQPHIAKILTDKRGVLSVDKRSNMLIITDTQEKVDQAKDIIYRLDRVTPQIMIEAKVVEVSDDFSRKLGAGLSLRRGQSPLPYNNPDFTLAMNAEPAEEAAFNFGSFNLYRIFGSTVTWLNAELTASEVKGDLKIVSSPRILTLDNKKAKIKQGLEIPYVLETWNDGEITKSILFKQVDLLLEVTPHVTPDRRISMTLHLTKNDIDAMVGGVPSISTNEADTELLVNDNDTIIIGGVVKKSISQSKSGFPFLMNIPGLGRLFRTDSNTDQRTEMLIFLTPKIVQLQQKSNIATD